MTNPFSNESLVPTWTVASEILKGDLPGHPFHGNQYSAAKGLSDRAGDIQDKVFRVGRLDPADDSKWASRNLTVKQMRSIADAHGLLATDHHLSVEQSRPESDAEIAHADARDLHGEAADAWRKAADTIEKDNLDPKGEAAKDVLDEARQATDSATGASEGVLDHAREGRSQTVAMPNANGEPTLVASVERHSIFGKSAEITKGDMPGHPFHGNQYTPGMGGTFHPAGMERGRVGDFRRAIKEGTKLTLIKDQPDVVIHGNTGTTTLPGRKTGTTYTVTDVRSRDFIGTGADGREMYFDFPQDHEMTYTPENNTVTFHDNVDPKYDTVYKISN